MSLFFSITVTLPLAGAPGGAVTVKAAVGIARLSAASDEALMGEDEVTG